MFLPLRVLSRVSSLSFLSLCLSHEQRRSGSLSQCVSHTRATSFRKVVSHTVTVVWEVVCQCVPHTSSTVLEGCLSVSLTWALLSGGLSVSVSLTQAALFWKGVSHTGTVVWKIVSRRVSHTGSIVPEGCFSACLSHWQHCSRRFFLSGSLTWAALFPKVLSQCVSHTGSIALEACLSCLSH